MVKVRNFHEAIEKDLGRLTSEIKEQKSYPEVKILPEKEILKKSVQVVAGDDSRVGEPKNSPSINSSLPNYLSSTDPKIKLEVEKLIDLVFREGLLKTLKEAKKHSPFVEDAFHDALVDKLLPELKEKGVI